MELDALTASGTKDGFAKLAEFVDGIGKKLPTELSAVLNKTATKVVSSTKEPKGIRQELSKLYASGIKARDVKNLLKKSRASKTDLKCFVKINRKNRPSISLFKPSFTKKGVTYRMLRSEGRKRIPSGFKYGNKAAKRATKKRYPLIFPKGVSPAVLFLGTSGLYESMPPKISQNLNLQVEARIQFLLYKISKDKGVRK